MVDADNVIASHLPVRLHSGAPPMTRAWAAVPAYQSIAIAGLSHEGIERMHFEEICTVNFSGEHVATVHSSHVGERSISSNIHLINHL